jgi:hypothetical protein
MQSTNSSDDESLVFKQFAVISVSSFLYYRKLFPKEAFKEFLWYNTPAFLIHPIIWRKSKYAFNVVRDLIEFTRALENNIEDEFIMKISEENKIIQIFRLKFQRRNKDKIQIYFA